MEFISSHSKAASGDDGLTPGRYFGRRISNNGLLCQLNLGSGMLSSFALAWSSFPAMKIKGSIDWTIGLPKAPNMGSVAPVVSDCLSPRKPFERLAHGWSFPRLDIFS